MHTRRLLQLLAGAAIAGVLVIALAAPASAHAILENENPSSGSTIATSPPEVTLHFSEAVEISLGSVRVFSCSGGRVSSGAPHHTSAGSSVVAASLPNLSSGLYVVTWRVISADSHPVHGAFTFTVGSGAGSGTPSCTAAETSAKSSKTVGVLLGITRFGVYTGLALLIGGAVFLVLIARGTSAARRVRHLIWIGFAITALATVFGIMLQGPYGAGTGLGDAFKTSVVNDILKTRYGHIAELRLLGLAAAVPLLVVERKFRESRPVPVWWYASGAIVGLFLASTPGLAGHASTGDHTIFAVPLDTLHVAAMCIWLGGLVALLVTAIGGGFSGGLRRALIRFSAIAFGCVVTLVVTGLFASWREVGFKIKGYTSTSYGNILLVKIGIVIVLVGVAAVSRAIVRRRRAAPLDAPDSAIAAIDDRTVRELRRSVGGEVLLGIAVLIVTVLLVNAAPARTAIAPKLFSAEVHAGTGENAMLIDITVDPSRSGVPNAIHIYTLKPDGTQLVIQKITATGSLQSQGIAGLPIDLHRRGANHFSNDVTPTVFPGSGKWKLEIHVLRNQFTDVAAIVTVPVL
jgi:copper transport protein